ncbi:hypothetical protein [Leucobacter salsicius]|uniref:hypothetical protein n=1 Tax=Leucobacter salsicius TaxID=664638 RepID=UPI00034ACD37|nr:hypothetical protein [Leucobacter salsicius]
MSTTIARPSRARRTALGLATLAVAASAVVTLPLVSQPAPAQAASLPQKGCPVGSINLVIEKTNPAGEPLAGAVFDVTGDLASAAMTHSPRWSENGARAEVEAAMAHYEELNVALVEAEAELANLGLTLSEAEAALTDAKIVPTDLRDLYEQRTAANVAAAEAQEILGQALEALAAAEWNGDPVEIAGAQAVVDKAQAAVDAAHLVMRGIEDQITPLAEAYEQGVADAEAAVAVATEVRDNARDALRPAKAVRDDALEAQYRAVFERGLSSADVTERVTTDADGRAVVQLISPLSGCTLVDQETGEREELRPTLSIPEIVEVEAPDGYQLSLDVHSPAGEMPGEQDDEWTVTIVNVPEEPVALVEPEEPEEPEEPVAPVEPPKPGVPLVQTGSDLTGPIVGFSAILAAAGAALASGPLLRRIRAKRA